MPIRLTIAYGERLAKERFDIGSQIRKDIVLLCEFVRTIRKIDASNFVLLRGQLARITQEGKSATDRILNSKSISDCTFLQPHERFELSFLAAVLAACVSGLEVSLPEIADNKTLSKNDSSENEKERRTARQLLSDKLESLSNVEILFLIGSNPDEYIKPFLRETAATILTVLQEKEMQFEGSHKFVPAFVEAAINYFRVWVSSDYPAAKWIAGYLNYQHQNAWAAQVSDDVKSIQQALADWVQPTSEAPKKRADAWARYKNSLLGLPDHKETMFAEQFGVRRVFVQPLARYKVAGMNLEQGATVPDVANLIAGLISDRVPGDELILLCGGPGSGKSTLCRIVASELASNPGMHPVFLRLRRLQDGQDIPTFVEAHLQKEGIIDKFSDLADVSNLVLILDGFDELVMASRSRLREFFNTLREDLVTGPLRNSKAIVSGRDTLFPNGAGLPTGSHVISLSPFDKPRIAAWGEKWRILHPTDTGRNFRPEAFFDEKADHEASKAPPLHHLVSWPLTLHLVARVHDSGALELANGARQKIEKAVLYKSIVAQTALRQQEQSGGKGRLLPEQMREFVQAISWEMYSTSRDALDYSEGLPILKSIYPAASEVELSELADVAIVNQPELTKGEESGFEFVHKSFSEYFVAEKIAHTIEKVCFKAQDYDSDNLTWRMSVKEAISELSSLISIRVITSEVQEMCEPMLADFRSFLRPQPDEKGKPSDLIDKLTTKKTRLEELIREYASGGYQSDVVDRVRGSKIVRNEREIHANFSVGLLIIACVLSKRLAERRPKKADHRHSVLVEDGRLWKLISIIQSGDIQIDWTLAQRSLNPLRVTDGEMIEVPYPPIPPRLLLGVKGVRFPIDNAVGTMLDIAASLLVENSLLTYLAASSERRLDVRISGMRILSGGRFPSMLSDTWERLLGIGIVPHRDHEWDYGPRFHHMLDDLFHRIARYSEKRPELGEPEFEEIRHMLFELKHRSFRGRGGIMFEELIDRIENVFRRAFDRVHEK